MPDSVFGIPYEYYLISIGLLMAWAAFKASHNKVIARVSILSFAYTLVTPMFYGFDKIKETPFLYYSFGVCFFTFLTGGCIWMVLDGLVSIRSYKFKNRVLYKLTIYT